MRFVGWENGVAVVYAYSLVFGILSTGLVITASGHLNGMYGHVGYCHGWRAL